MASVLKEKLLETVAAPPESRTSLFLRSCGAQTTEGLMQPCDYRGLHRVQTTGANAKRRAVMAHRAAAPRAQKVRIKQRKERKLTKSGFDVLMCQSAVDETLQFSTSRNSQTRPLSLQQPALDGYPTVWKGRVRKA